MYTRNKAIIVWSGDALPLRAALFRHGVAMFPKRRIAFISLSRITGSTDLFDALQNAGLELNKDCASGRDWSIAFFGADGCTREALETTRNLARDGQVLCVLHASCRQRCPEILSNCVDFLQWPCAQAALRRRLELCGILEPAPDSANTAEIVEQFVDFNLIGESPAFVRFLQALKNAARYGAPVLLEGETGTGKELAARAIHYLGARRDQPFIPVNCGAIPDDLFENELFGHEKGAFTDARESQEGLVSLAEGGTLFLDEVESLSARAQVKLLRFLQNHEYKPLGGQRVRRANIRTISASNARLDVLVAEKSFRSDLLYRLRVVYLEPPPLRARPGDVEVLARHFLRYFAGHYGGPQKRLSAPAVAWMNRHDWPGNVRELENLLHCGYIGADDAVIHLPDPATPVSESADEAFHELSFHDAKAETIRHFEVAYLSRLIADCRGNVTLAARKAGKERRALGKLLKKHHIPTAK
jgi:DNA-binding NtrC family response regulator